MKVVIQRVLNASIAINGGEPHPIGRGLVALFGVGKGDELAMAEKLAYKTANLRVFEDAEGRMNRSAAELGLEVLAAPNFTLCADTSHGLRPSFAAAAGHELARPAFELFIAALGRQGLGGVVAGEFGADMQIALVNDGPVTVIMDTDEWRKA